MLNFSAQNTQTKTETKNEDRPKTLVWLNIGFEDAEGRFVNLPVGVPLDTTAPLEIRGQNAEWNGFQKNRNALLNYLTKYGLNMDPGSEEVINGLQIRIKHVNTEAADSGDEVVDFSKMIGGSKVTPIEAAPKSKK